MKKSAKSTILNSLLLILSLGITYLIFGQKTFFGYVGSVLIGLGAVVISVVGYYGIKQLLLTSYPIQEPDPSEAYALETSSYKVYELIFEILITIGWAIGVFFSYKLLVWLSIERLKLIPGVFIVPIGDGIWLLPSILIGALFGILIAVVGIRIILRNRYKSFIMYLEIFSLKMNSKKLLQWIVISFFVINTIFVYCFLASYTRFTEDGIHTHRAVQLTEEFHPYTQVAKVEELIRKNTYETSHEFLIQFYDGHQWRLSTGFGSYEIPEIYSRIMKYVSQKSGQPYLQLVYKPQKSKH
jgi:hypothetical protein